jgi:outer membrane immunogenic protein
MMRAAIAGGLVLALGTAAYSADMPIKAAPIYIPPPITWTGPYVGGNLGGGWFNPGGSADVPSIPIAKKKYTPDPLFGLSGGSGAGFIGGVQAGYNYQFLPRWLVGIEGDFDGATFSSDQSTAPLTLPGSSASMSQNVDWLASIRGRVGYLWTPTILLYGTGGAAWADVNYSGSATVQASPSVTAATSFSSVRSGWIAGAGAEYMWSPQWLLRAEYLFYSFNGTTASASLSPAVTSTPVVFAWDRLAISVIRIGASYRF